MLTYSELQKVFWDWVIAVSGYANDHVIWEYANAPRPARPYVSMRFMSITPIGQPDMTDVDVAGNIEIRGQYELTLTINVFESESGSELGAIALLDKLRLSLYKESVKEIFRDKQLGFMNALNIVNLEQELGTAFEQRATMDMLFNLVRSIEDNVGWIENIEAVGNFTDATGQVIRTIDIEV